MKKTGLSAGKTAESLEVSTATIRNWVNKFGDYLSPSATRATGRRFLPEDINTLRKINQLLRDGYKYSEVADRITTVEILEELPPLEHFEDPEQEPEQINAIQNVDWWELMQERVQVERERGDEWKHLYLETKAELDRERLPFWQKWRKRPEG